MSEYVIVTDSSADLSQEMVRELGVEVIPLRCTIGPETFADYPDHRQIEPEVFYDRIRAGEAATTSAVNIADVKDGLEPLLKAGKDVLVLAFSSGLSTTCQSFRLAAEELEEEHPGRKCCVVDTLCASLGQGLLVYLTAQKRKAGATIEEARDFAESTKLKVCHWFTVDDLMYLKRGGRVSAATAVLGTMLAIKPVLHVDDEGHLINMSKARGRKAALAALADKVGELATDPAEQTMFLSHSDCLEDAQYVAGLIREKYGTADFRINFIGPVIGAHTGPGCVALFFLGKER